MGRGKDHVTVFFLTFGHLPITRMGDTSNLVYKLIMMSSWLGGSVVERRSLTGELLLVCTGLAADG